MDHWNSNEKQKEKKKETNSTLHLALLTSHRLELPPGRAGRYLWERRRLFYDGQILGDNDIQSCPEIMRYLVRHDGSIVQLLRIRVRPAPVSAKSMFIGKSSSGDGFLSAVERLGLHDLLVVLQQAKGAAHAELGYGNNPEARLARGWQFWNDKAEYEGVLERHVKGALLG